MASMLFMETPFHSGCDLICLADCYRHLVTVFSQEILTLITC